MLLRRRESEGVERQHDWAVHEFETKDAVKRAKEGSQTPHIKSKHIQEELLHS